METIKTVVGIVEHLQPNSPASFLERWPVEGIKHGHNVSSCFNLSRLTTFSCCIAHKTGRLVQPVVQGGSLFNVMGQETCEYSHALQNVSH